MIRKLFCIFTVILGASICTAGLQDPGFGSFKEGRSPIWKNGANTPVKAENGVLIMTGAAAKFHASVFQGKRIAPGSKTYMFSADVDAPVARKAYLQIKFYKNGKEVKRISSRTAPAGKSKLIVFGSQPDADIIEVAMRIAQGADGKEFKFSNPELCEAEDGELFGNWQAVGKGFNVTNQKANSFTINVTGESQQHAAVLLQVGVAQNTRMIFSSDVEGPAPGYLEVKLFNNGKMLRRVNNIGSSSNSFVEFETGNADSAVLHCRVPAVGRNIGKSVTFTNLKLKKAK